MNPPIMQIDDDGLVVNGIRLNHNILVGEVEGALGENGIRVLLGPPHLVKPTDNQAVVFANDGIVILEEVHGSVFRQFECVFDMANSIVKGVASFSGRLEVFGVTIEAVMLESEARRMLEHSARTSLNDLVIELPNWVAFITFGKRTLLRRRSAVFIKSVTICPRG